MVLVFTEDLQDLSYNSSDFTITLPKASVDSVDKISVEKISIHDTSANKLMIEGNKDITTLDGIDVSYPATTTVNTPVVDLCGNEAVGFSFAGAISSSSIGMSRDDFLADISNAVPSSKTGDVYKINETTSSVKTIDGDDNAILQSKRTIEFLKGVIDAGIAKSDRHNNLQILV